MTSKELILSELNDALESELKNPEVSRDTKPVEFLREMISLLEEEDGVEKVLTALEQDDYPMWMYFNDSEDQGNMHTDVDMMRYACKALDKVEPVATTEEVIFTTMKKNILAELAPLVKLDPDYAKEQFEAFNKAESLKEIFETAQNWAWDIDSAIDALLTAILGDQPGVSFSIPLSGWST